MDWDLWLGPAPSRAFNKAIHPRGFRQFLDYANGTLGDWGRPLDGPSICGGPTKTHPKTVYSTGGRFVREDSTDAPEHANRDLRIRVVQRHLGAAPLCRQQRRAAFDRRVLLRYRGHVSHGLARWVDVSTPAKKKPADNPCGAQAETIRTAKTSRNSGPTSSTRSAINAVRFAISRSVIAPLAARATRHGEHARPAAASNGTENQCLNDEAANKLLRRALPPRPWVYPA